MCGVAVGVAEGCHAQNVSYALGAFKELPRRTVAMPHSLRSLG
jgi:hypothetical protein